MSDRSGDGSFETPSRGGVMRNCFFSPAFGLYVSKNLNLFVMSAVSILMSSTLSSHLTTSSKGWNILGKRFSESFENLFVSKLPSF